jgi:hypothetical protein
MLRQVGKGAPHQSRSGGCFDTGSDDCRRVLA